MSNLQQIKTMEVIHLGDELLFGLRANTHLEYLGKTFSKYGVKLVRDQVIRDQHDEIIECLKGSWGTHDMLILTGGLGPTVDDITRQAVAEFFNVDLVFNESIQKAIENRMKIFNRPIGKNNLRQCYQLEGSEILPNANGTAPGLWLEKEEKILVMLPGPPNELIPMVEDLVLVKLIETGRIQKEAPYLMFRTCGIGESNVETLLQPLIDQYEGMEAAYCVHSGVVDVRFSSNTPEGNELVKKAAEEASNLLGDDFVGYGECDIATTIVQKLSETKAMFAVAESITGGYIAGSIVDIPGASKVFSGGSVTYTDESKIKLLEVPQETIRLFGAVSPETAQAMAIGAAKQFSSTYGLSITGIAGPDGGSEKKPVGTVHIGFHGPNGTESKHVVFRGDRQTIRQRATVAALDLVRRKLQS